ncbi:hypothetical protein V491_04798 [Pseudogymnoascus sp. VKM F-3775]|nr:hypothetical protein V491_04798 [Pseudogymnoascus sp. VKM F-3775]
MENTSLTSPCRLEPVNLHDTDQFAELQKQRVICGWSFEEKTLETWRDKQQVGVKSLFWITIPDSSTKDNHRIRAGHISLNTYCDPPELDLARADKSVLTISSFFLLPEYRAYGLGKRVMALVEEIAVIEPYGSPRCRFITLTALSNRHLYDDGPECRGVWEKLGIPPPSFSIKEWYEKLGYVSWKEEPLYDEIGLDGQVVWLWEAFMRKEVQSESASKLLDC